MTPSYDVVLAGLDLSERSRTVFDAAVGAARALGAREIHLLSVIDAVFPWATDPDVGLGPIAEGLRERMAHEMEAQLEAFSAPPDLAARVVREVRSGVPVEALVARASELRAGLVVVASRDFAGLSRVLLGSVAHALIRAARVPVLVVGANKRPWVHPARVVVGVDLSSSSPAVIEHALAIAQRCGAVVEVVSCFERPWVLGDRDRPLALTPADEARLVAAHREAIAAALARAGAPASTRIEVLERRTPSSALLEASEREGPALVVVGASGQNAWQRLFLGSTARQVIEGAPCPVVVVPAPAPDVAHR